MRGVLFLLVCGIGTLNGVFLAGYLCLHAKGDAALNRLLAALLLTFTLRVAKAVAVFFVSDVHPLLELLWIGLLGSTGVIALVYVGRLTGAGFGARRLLRAGVLAVAGGALAFLLIPLSSGWKLLGVALAVYASMLGVVAPRVWAGPGDRPRERLRWPRVVVAFLGAVWLFYAVMMVGRLRGEVAEDTFFDIEALVLSLAVYAMLYAELRFGVITRTHRAAGSVESISRDDPMLKRLRHAVEVERLYLDPSLSLPSLARTLKLSRQHVSKLLNAGLGATFNDYVNRLRVEEVQRRLALPDGPSRKIGQLGFDVGFNSSSVFYAAFRKFTGKTPSEYVKDLARS